MRVQKISIFIRQKTRCRVSFDLVVFKCFLHSLDVIVKHDDERRKLVQLSVVHAIVTAGCPIPTALVGPSIKVTAHAIFEDGNTSRVALALLRRVCIPPISFRIGAKCFHTFESRDDCIKTSCYWLAFILSHFNCSVECHREIKEFNLRLDLLFEFGRMCAARAKANSPSTRDQKTGDRSFFVPSSSIAETIQINSFNQRVFCSLAICCASNLERTAIARLLSAIQKSNWKKINRRRIKDDRSREMAMNFVSIDSSMPQCRQLIHRISFEISISSGIFDFHVLVSPAIVLLPLSNCSDMKFLCALLAYAFLDAVWFDLIRL